MSEEELYIGCKIIKAEQMHISTFRSLFSDIKPATEEEWGYKVTYPDGYISWSPISVFENAYRKISDNERKFIEGED